MKSVLITKPLPVKNPIYPINNANVINQAFNKFLKDGTLMSGKKAKGCIPDYYQNFEVLGVYAGDINIPDQNLQINSLKTQLVVRCKEHQHSFITTPRYLFATTSLSNSIKCLACQHPTKNTVKTISERLQDNDEVDFLLDKSMLTGKFQNMAYSVKSNDRLPVICKRHNEKTNQPCETRTTHQWNNLRTVLYGNPKFLHCQGPCESSPRGKSSRTDRADVEFELNNARAGTWVIPQDVTYIKKSENCWLEHVLCKGRVYRFPQAVINYSKNSKLSPNTDQDCPYCSHYSIFHCINKDPLVLSNWLCYITDDSLQLQDVKIYPKSSNSIHVICKKCSNAFSVSELKVLNNTYHGCIACQKTAARQLRAWKLDNAKYLVQQRGYELLSDPKSYTEQAEIVDSHGCASEHKTILDLLKAMPASPNFYLPCSSPMQQLDFKQQCQPIRRYAPRQNAFDSITPLSAYCAGIVASDGCISGNKIKFAFSAIDEGLLVAILRLVEGDNVITYRTMPNVKGRNVYANMTIYSKQMVNSLKTNFGIGPRKTLALPAPKKCHKTV